MPVTHLKIKHIHLIFSAGARLKLHRNKRKDTEDAVEVDTNWMKALFGNPDIE